MSIYSDHKVGALSDEEFMALCAREDRLDRMYELAVETQGLYYTDDDMVEEDEYGDDEEV